MARDQLQLSVGQARVAGEPSDRLMTEGVRGRPDASFLCVLLHDLLHPPCRELRGPLGLEEIPVVGMSGDVGPQSGGEALAEEDIPIFRALPLIDANLTVFQINVSYLNVAQFGNSNHRVEEEPQHQSAAIHRRNGASKSERTAYRSAYDGP